MSLFALLATLLSAVGLYGVAATAANRRVHEMAVRAALGATHGSITRLIIGAGASGVLAGTVAGTVLAFVASRLLSPYLYSVGSADPITYAGVIALVALTTVVATWMPARRATRVSLVDVLRGD